MDPAPALHGREVTRVKKYTKAKATKVNFGVVLAVSA